MLLKSLVDEFEIVKIKIQKEGSQLRLQDGGTGKENRVAIIGHGAFSLTRGNSGREAIKQEMIKKAVLLRELGGVRGIPLFFNTSCIERTIELVKVLEPSFGGIILTGMAAPVGHILEGRLKKDLSIPVLQDIEDGISIAMLAGLINALKRVNKSIGDARIVVHGAGVTESGIFNLLLSMGVKDLIPCDSDMPGKMMLTRALHGADVFIGFSSEISITAEMISGMNQDPIVFALADPFLQIIPEEARAAGAKVVVTGSQAYPNYIHDALVFPGLFRGALDVQAMTINDEMRIAVAKAISGLMDGNELERNLLPSIYDDRVVTAVAGAVAKAAIETGVWTLIRGAGSKIC